MASGWAGVELANKIRSEFGIARAQAYKYIERAKKLALAEVRMSEKQLRAFCKRKFLDLTRASDRHVQLAATKELAKHASFYPVKKLKVTNKYDEMSAEELDRIARERGLK